MLKHALLDPKYLACHTQPRPTTQARLHLGCEGQERLHDGLGGDEGHELGVDQLHLVAVLGHKVGEQLVSHSLGLLGGGALPQLKGGCMSQMQIRPVQPAWLCRIVLT